MKKEHGVCSCIVSEGENLLVSYRVCSLFFNRRREKNQESGQTGLRYRALAENPRGKLVLLFTDDVSLSDGKEKWESAVQSRGKRYILSPWT
jgi:hypothetical protein